MLHHSSEYLFCIPGPGIEFLLLMAIPINPVFDAPEEYLHKHRLRTSPSAPYSSIGYGKEDDEHHQRDHPDKKEVEILGPELNPEDDKNPVKKIKQQQLLSIHLDKRRRKEEYQQQYAGNIPCGGQCSFGSLCKNPNSFAAFIDGVKPVAKTAGGIILCLHITYKARPAVLLDLAAWYLSVSL